jgi:hypothetical protein
MNFLRNSKTLFLLYFCAFVFLSTSHVQAQTILPRNNSSASPAPQAENPVVPINLTVSPISIVLETDPGIPVQSQLRVRNNSTANERLEITIGSFTSDGSGGQPRLIDPNENDEFLSWLKFETTQFDAPSNEWTTVPFSFEPSEEAALSYYYSVILSRATEPGETDGQAVVQGAPAVLVLATVNSPHAKKELRLVEFKAKNPITEFLPQEFVARIENSGNVHLGPSGNVFVDAQTKQDIAILPLNPGSGLILPQSTREYTVRWEDGFPVRKNTEDTDDKKEETGMEFWGIEFNFSNAHKFRMGQYTAHLLMVYDNGERDVPIESFVSFWVIPWRILLVALVIGVFVLLGLRSVLAPVFRPLGRMFKKKDSTS